MITILLEKIKALLSELKTNIENIKTTIDYSTDEVEIGKWIDGKTLYRKTLTTADMTDGDFDVTSLNIDTFVGFDSASYLSSNRNITPINYYRSGSDICVCRYQPANKLITCYIGTGMSIYSMFVTILYTKTEV